MLDVVVELLDRTAAKLVALARIPLSSNTNQVQFLFDNVLSNGDIEKELKFLMAATW